MEEGSINKNTKGRLRVTDKYVDLAVNKVPESVNKVHPIGELSATKNNNRIKENINNDFFKRYKTPSELGMA